MTEGMIKEGKGKARKTGRKGTSLLFGQSSSQKQNKTKANIQYKAKRNKIAKRPESIIRNPLT